MPEEIPVHFTLGEVASFSRWYLKDYPVRVELWRKGLCQGESKGVVSKYMMEMGFCHPYGSCRFSYRDGSCQSFYGAYSAVLSGYRLYSSLRPVASGIDGLISGKRVLVPEQGLTESWEKANQAAAVLTGRDGIEQRDTARTEWISACPMISRTPLSMVMGYAII